MKIEVNERTIRETVYVSDDGRKFPTPELCQAYEKSVCREQLRQRVMEYAVEELCGVSPLCIGDYYNSDEYEYTWFLLPDESAYRMWSEYYDCHENIASYPFLVCVEEGYSDAYSLSFDFLKSRAEEFFKKHGYKISLEKEA